MQRTVVKINEARCIGCGERVSACPQGALEMVGGKARLAGDLFCDGLGTCTRCCHRGAISREEREAAPYDERRVMAERVVPGGMVRIAAHLEYLKMLGKSCFLVANQGKYMGYHAVTVGVTVLFGYLLQGCASGLQAGSPERPREVTVMVATDRAARDTDEPDRFFGSERGGMRFGACRVSLPPDHELAEIESPFYADDAAEHLLLTDIVLLEEQAFSSLVAAGSGLFPGQGIFLYVHGFNMSFSKAVRYMGQLTADLDYRGCPVLFSWPSKGKVTGYDHDEGAQLASQQNLAGLLGLLASRCAERELSLLGHSMGGRLLVGAVQQLLERQPGLASKIGLLILVAPDIDSDRFAREVAPALREAGIRVVLYASKGDRALRVSGRLHGAPRAGAARPRPLVLPGIETIDADGIDGEFFGHTYHHRSRDVISDLYYLLNFGLGPDCRFSLEPVDTTDGRYWRFRE